MQENTFRLFERINSLLQAEERKGCTARGLKLVHAQILDYLAQCSSHSDTPLAVAEFLNLTKGTVSTSISVLERKGYIEKIPDEQDKRVVHLRLSKMGRILLSELKPMTLFSEAEQLLRNTPINTVGEALSAVLAALQNANQVKSFGICKSCSHLIKDNDEHYCDYVEAFISPNDEIRICRYHTPIRSVQIK